MLLVPVILTLALFGFARLFVGVPVAGTWLGVGGFVLLAVLGIIGLRYVVFAASFAAWAHARSLQSRS